MAKTKTAIRQEARERAQKRQEAELAKRQRLIDGATEVFETLAEFDLVGEKQDDAIAKAQEKFEKEVEAIRERFAQERMRLETEQDNRVRAMLNIEGATIKDVADAVALSQAEVKRVRSTMPKQSESLDLSADNESSAAPSTENSAGADSPAA